MIRIAAKPESVVARLDSLADETRLRLLRLLERQELGVVELCDVLQLPQSTVSRHLKILSDRGWVHSRSAGSNHLYRMLLDELTPADRQLWLVMREQTVGWLTLEQDELRLERRLRDRETDSHAFFAGAAAEWDRLRTQWYGQGFSRSAIASLLPASWLIADLGCGTGTIAGELAPFVRRVIGVDNSAAMLKAARRRIAGLHNVELRQGDLESLPIEKGVCDAALLILTLSYVANPVTVLREAARILQPGARVVVVNLLPHDRDDFRRQTGQRVSGFESKKIAATMREAGFVTPAVHNLPPEPRAKGPALFLAVGACRAE